MNYNPDRDYRIKINNLYKREKEMFDIMDKLIQLYEKKAKVLLGDSD